MVTMANFGQLVRRQSMRDIFLNRQFSRDVEERLEMREFKRSLSAELFRNQDQRKRKRPGRSHGRKTLYGSVKKLHLAAELHEDRQVVVPGSDKKAALSKRDSKKKMSLKTSKKVPKKKSKKVEIEVPSCHGQATDKCLERGYDDPKDIQKADQQDQPGDHHSNRLLAPTDNVANIKRTPTAASQFSQPPDEEDGTEPEAWDSKITFILATIGYAVGLGNVWRFPYLAQKNGGGAFLIPYWIMLMVQGLPMFLLEMAAGQRLRKGALGAWNRVSPYLGGIGIASGIVAFNVALYYNTIIAWCLFYFSQSFVYPLPWAECPTILEEGANEDYTDNMTLVISPVAKIPVHECEISSPTQYFWYRETLDVARDVDDFSGFNLKIAGALLAAWVLVYLCIVKGITENPKIIYVTAIYPYVVLVIFFCRAVTLEGMSDGVLHLFTPKWEKLKDPVVWLEAGTQIFFSLGLGFGGLIAYSSYNPANNNCTRDAIIVAFTNCLTSMFAGIVIFAIMGFKAHTVHKSCLEHRRANLSVAFDPETVEAILNGTYFGGESSEADGVRNLLKLERGVTFMAYVDGDGNDRNVTLVGCNLADELDNSASGTGLAFILFTEAMNQFPAGNIWAIMFFLMLFTLGLDSQFGTLQGVVQCVVDLKILPSSKKELLTGMICGISFILSMCFALSNGNYIFTLFDNFSGTIPLLCIAFAECVSISYLYGLRRFSRDIELMTGSKPSFYWLFCWKYLCPVAMLAILGASIVQMALSGSTYEVWNSELGMKEDREWPAWCLAVSGILVSMSLVWIPIVALLAALGKTFIPYEGPGWFPAEELREWYGLDAEREDSWLEQVFFGFRADGREGLFVPTFPRIETTASFMIANANESPDFEENDDDDDEDGGPNFMVQQGGPPAVPDVSIKVTDDEVDNKGGKANPT